jgi:UDP-N-acetylmuramoyl-L-alanyl-D-glutamate--2,6-diaminopimelate ligase
VRTIVTVALTEVCAALPSAEHRGEDVLVTDAVHDSRAVRPGALFCAIVGATSDGHDHVPAAIEAGAVALLVERELDVDTPQVLVPSVRAATGPAAAVVHGHPSRELDLVGVTGTNGKTTVAYLLEGAFAAAALGTGVIGTVETRIHGAAVPGVRTTPEGTDLQRLLREMVTRGVDAVAMEVSSHGLSLHRVDGTRFRVAVYTNLSQDHLDFHPTMDDYLAAKARLFSADLAERAVVHLDGPWAQRLLEHVEVPVTTVGVADDADVRMSALRTSIDGGTCLLHGLTPEPVTIETGAPGRFNLDNAATAIVAAVTAGVPLDAAIAGVAACPGAPGRLERVERGQPFTVFVDYAHTPEAVTTVLDTLRAASDPRARLIIVLGCGGDRDTTKRAPMGAAAAAADLAVLTADNPRSEDPMAIIATMQQGADRAIAAGAPATLAPEPDRRAAIALALDAAGPGDVVVVAGKGHERTQTFADRTVPFDDVAVVEELLDGSAGDASVADRSPHDRSPHDRSPHDRSGTA